MRRIILLNKKFQKERVQFCFLLIRKKQENQHKSNFKKKYKFSAFATMDGVSKSKHELPVEVRTFDRGYTKLSIMKVIVVRF